VREAGHDGTDVVVVKSIQVVVEKFAQLSLANQILKAASLEHLQLGAQLGCFFM